jgi:hypothetical protein
VIHPDLWTVAAVVLDVERMALRGQPMSGSQKRAHAVSKLGRRKQAP